MTTDFRSLLEDLVEEVLDANQYMPPGVQSAIARARAALAEPQPELPTDEELMEVFWEHDNGMEELWPGDWLAAARTVLARWGS